MHLSVIIITLNEEKNLPRTLESLRELKQSKLEMEVLVLDSGSTDRTKSIAKGSGAKFAIQNWLGYSKQKNHALADGARRRDYRRGLLGERHGDPADPQTHQGREARDREGRLRFLDGQARQEAGSRKEGGIR